jgi:hypothetical protein
MKMFAAALLIAGALPPAAAFADTIGESYGHSFRVTLADGTANIYRFKADKTATLTTPDNQTAPATWEVKDSQICIAVAGGAPTCSPYSASHKVGDTWTEKDANGQDYKIEFLAAP